MSRIRTNLITNRMANGAPTVSNGLIVSGVTTVTTLDLNGDLDVDGHLNADNVSIAGVVTATSFVGSGANLTSLPAQATIANNADNRVITGGSGVNLNGEANMTFDGSTLTLTPGSSAGDVTSLVLGRTSSAPAAQTTAVVTGGIPVSGVPGIFFGSTNTNLPAIGFQTPNSSNGHIVFNPKGSERLRIDSVGSIGQGTGTPRTPDGSNADNPLNGDGTNGNPVFTIYGDSPAINLVSSTTASGDYSLINFGRTGSSSNPYRAVIGYKQSSDILRINAQNAITFDTGGNINTGEKLRINSDGTVTMGQVDTSSTSALHIRSITSAETTLELSTKDNYNGSLPSAKISFTQQNGTEIARIKCDTNTGAANMADLTFWTNYGGLYERMRINKTGQVGINQTTPRRPLDIIGNDGASGASSGNSDTTILLDNAGGNGSMIEFLNANNSAGHLMFTDPDATNQGRISYHHNGDYLRFDAGGTEMLRLYGDVFRVGNSLGSAAAGRFQVVEERGGNRTNDCNVYFETNANDWNLKTYYNSAGTHYHIMFLEQGTNRGMITGSDGSNVTYSGGSDYRWKENIVEMTGTEGIDICKKLKPSKYNWIENREETGQINTVDGFIAHEVVEAGVLGAVSGEKDAVNEDGSIKGQMLDYGQMTPVLAAAIKGLITKVETLEQDNIALRARVTNLEGN